MSNAYQTLGVEPTASLTDIKVAYRNLRGKHHPDRNPDCPASAAAFRAVQEAYEAVGTEEAREYYDRHGCSQGDGPNVERDAARLVAETISQTLERCECLPCRLPRKMKPLFDGLMDRAASEASSFRTELANLDGFRKLIEPDQYILDGFAMRESALQHGLGQAEHALKVIERAREMVDVFRFKAN